MIPVPPLTSNNEPQLFDGNCRKPGLGWLAHYPEADPHERSRLWSQFQPHLAKHFQHRCGWLGTNIQLTGDVDHWLACGQRKGLPSPYRHLAFEWSNFRYIDGRVNSLKQSLDDCVLDPCEVKPGWFEVLLPSFQMVPTFAVPIALRERARFTVEKLQLRLHQARWTRWSWYRIHWRNGSPDLDALRLDAPLVAQAVEKALSAQSPLPDPHWCEPTHSVVRRKRDYSPRPRRNPSETTSS